MSDALLLMQKDRVVMEINFDEGVYTVVNGKYLPYQLRGRLPRIPDFSEIKSRHDDIQRTVAMNKCYNSVISFLSSRVLPLSRENAKKIYNLFGFAQLQDEVSKAKIALVCRAVSLQDDYWVKLENDTIKWADINLRTNHLSEIVAQVSLHGSSLSLQGAVHTPELTGQGAYAKAWIREKDGLYLYKKGAKDCTESKIEVEVSNILDACNVPHIKYLADNSQGDYTCKCRCMTTEDLSILPGMDFISYCNVNGLDYREEMMHIDSEMIYKMWIVDYLVSNRDRHGLNWGFFYNSDTMDIIGCHPLFDHNNSFDKAIMENENAEYLFDNTMTMKQAARIAMQRVDFHFTRKLTRSDFLTTRHYESFMKRAKELNIPVKENELDEDINNVDISLDEERRQKDVVSKNTEERV